MHWFCRSPNWEKENIDLRDAIYGGEGHVNFQEAIYLGFLRFSSQDARVGSKRFGFRDPWAEKDGMLGGETRILRVYTTWRIIPFSKMVDNPHL